MEDFLSQDLRQRLEDFVESGIADINITQYQEQINAGIINNTLLEEQLMVLQSLSATFNSMVSVIVGRLPYVEEFHFLCPIFPAI